MQQPQKVKTKTTTTVVAEPARSGVATLDVRYELTGRYQSSRVDIRLGPVHRRMLRAIFDAEEGRARLADGHVIARQGEVVLLLLERLAASAGLA